MTRYFKTKTFNRWARRVGLDDQTLAGAVVEMSAGLIDANLGGGVVKKRVALPGQGKRGSTRTLLATNFADRWIFIFGFEKAAKENLEKKELEVLKIASASLLNLTAGQLESAIRAKELVEVNYEQTKN